MISTTTNRVAYQGDGSSATFAFAYPFYGQSDLKVFLYASSTGIVSLQTLNTNYTVGGSPNLQGVYSVGGSVIFTSSIPNTHMIVLYRDGSQVQNYQLIQNGQINSVALVQQLDYLTLLCQRLQDQATRSLQLPAGFAPNFDMAIPALALVASTVLIVNSSATGWAAGPTADQIANAQSSALSAAISATAAGVSAASASASASAAAASAIIASSAAGAVTNLLPTGTGEIIFGSGTTFAKLAGQTTATRKFLSQTGSAAVSAAPVWTALAVADIPDISSVYMPKTGGVFTGSTNMSGLKISGVADPTTAQEAATKAYVDNVASGLNPLQACYAGTIGANIVGTYLNGVAGVGATFVVTATGAFTLDGTTPPQGSRILLKDQSSGFQNGIYDLTLAGSVGVSPILTRSLDYNTAATMNAGDLIPIVNGTVNVITSWLQTAVITTVGTDSLTFTEWSYNPAALLKVASNLSDVANANTSLKNILPFTTWGDTLYAGSGFVPKRLAIGTTGYVITSNGPGADPSWQPAGIAVASGILAATSGGTGAAGGQAGALAIWNGSSAILAAKSAITEGGVAYADNSNTPAFYNPEFYKNHLVNAGFDWWQVAVGSSVTVVNSTAIYVPDQWYITNVLGTNGVITVNRASSAILGSLFAASVQITTAPTAAQTNGTEMWQVVENVVARGRLYPASTINLGARIKALGVVNQIGIQLFQHSAEVKLNSTHSSVLAETTFTVASGSFTACQFQGTPTFGSELTGSVGMRIRITGVLSGSTHAVNNGFIVEQAHLGVGTYPTAGAHWQRKQITPDAELLDCMRFYETSFTPDIPVPSVATNGALIFNSYGGGANSANTGACLKFSVPKRAAPTFSFWDLNATATKYSYFIGSGGQVNNTTFAAITVNAAKSGITFNGVLVAASSYAWSIHWQADSRI